MIGRVMSHQNRPPFIFYALSNVVHLKSEFFIQLRAGSRYACTSTY